MSRIHILSKLISSLNNAYIIRKEYFYIRNTTYNLSFIRLLYAKNYIKFYSIMSKTKVLVFLSYNYFTNFFFKIIIISKITGLIYSKWEYLNFFLANCQQFSYSLIISTTSGLVFLEEAVKLHVGGILLCYLKKI